MTALQQLRFFKNTLPPYELYSVYLVSGIYRNLILHVNMEKPTRDKFSNPSEVCIRNNDWSARVTLQEKILPIT